MYKCNCPLWDHDWINKYYYYYREYKLKIINSKISCCVLNDAEHVNFEILK